MRTIIFRLNPGKDLKSSIESEAKKQAIPAGYIISCVGGLTNATIRMAGATPEKQDIRSLSGHFEIISLTGTISKNGCHLHISFSDNDGKVLGGHLKEGSIVSPTAEIVIGIDDDKIMSREFDEQTGFDELVINNTL